MAVVTPMSVLNCCVIEVFGVVFVLSRCFVLKFSLGVRGFGIGLSQISSLFFKHTVVNS